MAARVLVVATAAEDSDDIFGAVNAVSVVVFVVDDGIDAKHINGAIFHEEEDVLITNALAKASDFRGKGFAAEWDCDGVGEIFDIIIAVDNIFVESDFGAFAVVFVDFDFGEFFEVGALRFFLR